MRRGRWGDWGDPSKYKLPQPFTKEQPRERAFSKVDPELERVRHTENPPKQVPEIRMSAFSRAFELAKKETENGYARWVLDEAIKEMAAIAVKELAKQEGFHNFLAVALQIRDWRPGELEGLISRVESTWFSQDMARLSRPGGTATMEARVLLATAKIGISISAVSCLIGEINRGQRCFKTEPNGKVFQYTKLDTELLKGFAEKLESHRAALKEQVLGNASKGHA